MRKILTLAIFSLFLTACGSNPQSYIKPISQPMVNIDSRLTPTLEVNTKTAEFSVRNLRDQAVNFTYKLFWYDEKGVSQATEIDQNWQSITLRAKEAFKIDVVKPTEGSKNYRLYLKP